jgi:hypothetical protein
MIQINDIGLSEHYKQCAAKARASAEATIGEAAKAVHLNLAKLYDEIAAGYLMAEPDPWPAQD